MLLFNKKDKMYSDAVNNSLSIKIALASPEQIRNWSWGEVKKPETMNIRTLKPEREGLFCEKIFGPQKDWECYCGKYKRIHYKGIVCDRCGVEVTHAKVRRERMGHIELAAPVSHIWYFKRIPSPMGLLLDISPNALEKILYFSAYVVIDPGDTGLVKKQLLTEMEYREYRENYYHLFKVGRGFKAEMGAAAVKKLLQEINLDELVQELRTEVRFGTGQKKSRAMRRLEVAEAFRKSGNQPSWMILEVIPVIPPDLRPMVQLDGKRFATSHLNDLYRRVINRNNRLKRLLDLGAPDIIVQNEKRNLQEAVDALFDNGRRGRPVTGPDNSPLKSLSDMFRDEQGRFWQDLLDKRVDYSGRSVVVPAPELKLYQCGLPKEMALELFKPFVMKHLVNEGFAHNAKSAKRMVEKVRPEVWEVLDEVICDHPILLNRSDSLQRLGIQAFEPVLVAGRAIRVNPLVCSAYKINFAGEQMIVHVPLSAEAQAEARLLMLSTQNILNPQDGRPVVTPTQDVVMGIYYLTIEKAGAKGEGKVFSSVEETIMAYQTGVIELQARIAVDINNYPKVFLIYEEMRRLPGPKLFITTVGKLIFNDIFPADFPYINNPNFNKLVDDDDFILQKGQNIKEIIQNHPRTDAVKKGNLETIVAIYYRKYGNARTVEILDDIKQLGFTYATRAGITVGIVDVIIPEAKQEILANAEKAVERIEMQSRRGLFTNEERYNRLFEIWTKAKDDVTKELMYTLDRFNPIYTMFNSGARVNISQIIQLAGMRGLMADPTGRFIDIPIKANFCEGLTVLEYFNSAYGVRKELADDALQKKVYRDFTRRLVDVAQDVIVREDDCGTNQGITVSEIRAGNEVIEDLHDRICGRFALVDFLHPETGELLVAKDEFINEDKADEIIAKDLTRVPIRSVLTCRTRHGVCKKCYGRNLATGRIVDVGEAVGIIAAQSIGELGTQLTMRTFHTGGVTRDDSTQGLPRVEELFEARKPKGLAIIAEEDGVVQIVEARQHREIRVTQEYGVTTSYPIPYGSLLKVKDGDWVESGQKLTEGLVNPHDLLRVKGPRGVQIFLLHEVQRVYRLHGVDINDKHIEVIVRQMLKKVKVEEQGDTDFLPGGLVDSFVFKDINEEVMARGGEPAVARPLLLGITKASLATDSFLSAASFQEIISVLTEVSIKGKSYPLLGLKENVIIGKLIPAGTGMNRYRSIHVKTLD